MGQDILSKSVTIRERERVKDGHVKVMQALVNILTDSDHTDTVQLSSGCGQYYESLREPATNNRTFVVLCMCVVPHDAHRILDSEHLEGTIELMIVATQKGSVFTILWLILLVLLLIMCLTFLSKNKNIVLGCYDIE
jgi:hypothetical protein